MEVLIACIFSLNSCQRNIYIFLNKQIQIKEIMQILIEQCIIPLKILSAGKKTFYYNM